MELELRMNGVVESLDVAPNETLLTMLRREGYSSVKRGCETGECGACTVLVDGVSRPSCVMLAAQVGGCTVTTAEGLSAPRKLHPLQQAFIEVGAVQCGFCTPGMLLSASALLKRTLEPTEAEVRDALSGNLCRCTGYAKPIQAVMRAAASMRGEQLSAMEFDVVRPSESSNANVQLQNIGKPVQVLDAVRLVTGKPVFASDVLPRGCLHGRVLTSPHAHAIIRTIDVSQAKALPGVQAVLTYKDVPRIAYSSVERTPEEGGPSDHYSLDYIVRYVGDRVAVVAAETPEIAEQALKLIEVEYEVLPALLDPRQALEPQAPVLHPESESQGIYDAEHNIAARVRSEVGDVERGFAESDLVVEGEYLVAPVQPTPLENHTVVTYFDEDDALVVRTSSSVPAHIRRTLVTILGLPARQIRVIKPAIGGDFGVKQELVLEDLSALLTVATGKPVMLEYGRAEEFRSSRISQHYVLRLKTGVKRDGTMLANQMALLVGTGAHGTHPLIAQHAGSFRALALYPCANLRFIAEVLYTNLPPSGAVRGYGMPQECFALECHLDEIASQLDIDPLALRRKNIIKEGYEYPVARAAKDIPEAAPYIESSELLECLRIVEADLHWQEERANVRSDGRFRRGIGIALSLQGDSLRATETGGAMIKLSEDGSFDVFVDADSNGSVTMIAQIAAEVLDVGIEDILVHTSDLGLQPFSAGAHGSDAFYISAGVVKKAAERIRRQIVMVAGRMLGVLPEVLKIQAGIVAAPNGQRVTIAQVAEHALYKEHQHIITAASWTGGQAPLSFAAQGAEVEVDTETGNVRVLKVVTAVDAGSVINPLILEGHVQGSVVQALGAAVCEELIYDQKGNVLTTTFSDYHILNALDVPAVRTVLLRTADSSAPFGVKAVAEVSLNAVAPALANAVAHAIGVRLRQLPLHPERVLRALRS